jgi:virginiamycin B lyase
MNQRVWVYLAIAIGATAVAAQPKRTAASPKQGVKTPGIKTPGVAIPFASLKAEAEFPKAPAWVAFTEAALIADDRGLYRIDPKKNELGAAVVALNKPCGGAASGFGSLWVPSCGDQTLVRIDSKTWKITAAIASGAGSAAQSVAATPDSIWLLSDNKTTLARIDPEQNLMVSELRLPAGCNTLTFGESSLWVTCPSEDRVLRIDPQTNLVDKRIEMSAQPKALAIAEGSIWVLCQKDGKVERIDPKTNKVTKTIELGVPGAEGSIAAGQGSIWVTLAGFPITRIDPGTDKVVQQFWGTGGGAIHFGLGSVWLSNLHERTLWRLDPKRIAATLAE